MTTVWMRHIPSLLPLENLTQRAVVPPTCPTFSMRHHRTAPRVPPLRLEVPTIMFAVSVLPPTRLYQGAASSVIIQRKKLVMFPCALPLRMTFCICTWTICISHPTVIISPRADPRKMVGEVDAVYKLPVPFAPRIHLSPFRVVTLCHAQTWTGPIQTPTRTADNSLLSTALFPITSTLILWDAGNSSTFLSIVITSPAKVKIKP